MVRKEGSEYFVYNKTGEKKLSRGYPSKAEAEKRLGQIEYFKHQYDSGELLDDAGCAVTSDAEFKRVYLNDQ